MTDERRREILQNTLDYLADALYTRDVYRVLHQIIGMTDEELTEAGFDSVIERED